jgi:hypothetical protein
MIGLAPMPRGSGSGVLDGEEVIPYVVPANAGTHIPRPLDFWGSRS